MHLRRIPLLLAGLFLMAHGVATAATIEPNGQRAVHLVGYAQVAQSGRQTLLTLSADGETAGEHLEATLRSAPAGQPEGRREDRRGHSSDATRDGQPDDSDVRLMQLAGSFTMLLPDRGRIQGEASGQVDRFGRGSLLLRDADLGRTLSAAFSLDTSSRLQIDVSGLSGDFALDPSRTVPGDQTDHTFWFLARAAGLGAYLVLFITMVLGLGVRLHFLDGALARWRSFDLHQFTALVALGLLVLHLGSLLADHYVGFTLPQLLVPMVSPYRPAWTALGVLAMYLLLPITVSFYLRRFIGQRTWRALHYGTFFTYVLVLAHGVSSGTDSGAWWARVLYWSTGAVVAALTVWRFRGASGQDIAAEDVIGVRRPSTLEIR